MTQEQQIVEPTQRIRREKGDIAYWTDMAFLVEKVRVATQVRISHLAKTSRQSPDTEDFLKVAIETESFVDRRLATYAITHPTWEWASRIKGIGKENYPKVLGLIEAFGRYYDENDPWIPSFVTRQPEAYQVIEHGEVVDKVGIWVDGIERLATPSKLWKYAGLSVDPETGKAPKRTSGQLLSFNSELRMALYRLGTSLMRAKGTWYGQYEQIRQEIIAKKEVNGIKFVATPKGRMCLTCNVEIKAKRTLFCPECGERLTLKEETTGLMFLGHLHQMALREMIKEFLVCMWLVWREALGLPITQPYKVEHLDHKPIDPWRMVDRE